MNQGIRKALFGLVIGAGGYVAGSLGTFDLPFAGAFAQPDQGEAAPQMTPEMQAWMKAGTPGEHHEYLDQFVGEWDANVKFWMEPGDEPMTSTGTVTREWVLGGRFIQEKVKASSMTGGEYEAIGYVGYNNIDGRYEFAWVDNMSTSIMLEHGSYNPEEKSFFTYSTHRDPYTGKVVTGWGTVDVSDPDRHTMTGYQLEENGAEWKVFEGVFERK